jgi:hypothetical protein
MRRICTTALTASFVALAGCGGGGDDKSAKTPAASKPPYALSIDRADLVAGKSYTTQRFKPAFRFTAGKGSWIVENRESHDHFAVSGELDGFSVDELSWHRITRVFDPKKGGKLPSDQVPFSGDFAKWLTSHPRLRTTKPEKVTVAGLEGVQIDYTSKSASPRAPRDCGKAGPRCAILFYDGQDTVTIARGDRGRWIVLDLPDGDQLAIEEFASPGDPKHFSTMLKAFEPTLESLALVG